MYSCFEASLCQRVKHRRFYRIFDFDSMNKAIILFYVVSFIMVILNSVSITKLEERIGSITLESKGNNSRQFFFNIFKAQIRIEGFILLLTYKIMGTNIHYCNKIFFLFREIAIIPPVINADKI